MHIAEEARALARYVGAKHSLEGKAVCGLERALGAAAEGHGITVVGHPTQRRLSCGSVRSAWSVCR